jgi:cytochrome P450
MTVTTFQLNDPGTIHDPYPRYAALRDSAPVHYDSELDLWILSRYEDAAVAVRDAGRFSSDLGRWSDITDNPFAPDQRPARPLAAALRRLPAPRVLLTIDPPDHTMLRRKVSRAFTPRAIASWEPRIREVADGLVADMAARGAGRPVVDLVHEFASPLPTVVIAELMGIPADRRDDFKRWSDGLIDGLLTGGGLRTTRSALAISWFFAKTVRERRRNPGDDLISMLVTGGPEEALTASELVAFCVLLLVAGNETTTNLIANAVNALFTHQDAADGLRADPGSAPAVVAETLRHDGPAQGLLRMTTTDVVFDGVTIPARSRVLALIASANRDPRRWPDPDSFRPDRDHSGHLAFGTGIHHCLGHALTRLEASIALETLYRRFPDITPAAPPTRIDSPVLRGFRTLPVRLG